MKYLILLTTSLAVAALDQATKLYVHTHFALGESLDVLPGFFSITYIRNAGGAFGIFSNTNSVLRTILFIVFPVIAFFLIFNMIKKIKNNELIPIIALSFILGGALGNFIDRIHFQYVIDFLDCHTPNGWIFPTFNLADSFIVIGVFIVAWVSYRHPDKIPL